LESERANSIANTKNILAIRGIEPTKVRLYRESPYGLGENRIDSFHT